MNRMNRRDFLKQSAGALAAAAVLPGIARAEAPKFSAGGLRPLGNTGITTSLLGMGTGTKAWNGSSAQNRLGHVSFVNTLIHAHEKGVRYFDLADMYGSHAYMKDAIRDGGLKREDLMLLTKTVTREPEGIKADLDRFRKEAGTDYFDVVLLHCLTEGGWTSKLQACMDVLSEAKEQGIIRAHGVSCHNLDAMKDASVSPWVDVMLSRINPEGVRMDGTVEEVVEVLRTAHANGKGMLGMKILGEGDIADKIAKSLDFVLNLGCIDAITIGFLNAEEIDGAIEHIGAVA